MPIYEYRCLNCNKHFEKLVLRPDKDKIICPACSNEQVEKQMSVCSFGISKNSDSISTQSNTSSSSCSGCRSKNCSNCK